MDKKKFFITVISIILSFATIMLFHLMTSGAIFAQECRVIKIVKGTQDQSVKVEPEKLIISEGDCVVWFNISGEIVKITSLGRGDECANPVGFIWDKNNECFVTDYYGQTEITSMRFVEKGTYKYTVTVLHLEYRKVAGTVEVK